jgi:Do/DeqQ family serine protease
MTDSARHRFRPLSVRAATAGVAALAVAAGFAGGRATVSASSPMPPVTAQVAAAPAPSTALPSYSGVVERVAPAVVTVRVEKQAEASRTALPDELREFFGPEFRAEPRGRRQGGLGSGVIVGADGHILTNHHVIDGADRIRVDLADGRSFSAKLVGSDEASDLAVIKIEARDLPTLAYGDSDRIKVGDVVLAFGNPLGVGQTVTMGIVSAKGRATGLGDGSYEDFLQTDAPINQGNSGGALVNLQGELVGINAQILSPSGGNIGLGFAIPSGMARAVAEQLARDGVVHRSKLGVNVQSLTPELAESFGMADAHGALVSGVEPGSPADHAGLKQGDVIVSFNGRQVIDGNALRNQVASTRPETSVTIGFLRDGKTESRSVRLVEREGEKRASSAPAGEEGEDARFGMSVTPLTPRIAEQLELSRNAKGVVVTDVDPAGAAASAGIQEGDVITRVNDREVTDVGELREAMATRTDKPVRVLVNRRGASLFVAVPRERS